MTTEEVSGSQTATLTTEHTLAETGGANDLPAGGTYVLAVDAANLAGVEVLQLKGYTKARTGDTARVYFEVILKGVQGAPGLQSIPVPTAHYCKFTLEQNGGTGRAFPWAVYTL